MRRPLVVLVVLVASAASALEPVASRRALVRGAPGAVAAAALARPSAARARSTYEMELRSNPAEADADMGALMSQFKDDLKEKEAAKARKDAEEALPLLDQISLKAKKLQEAPPAPPAMGTSVPRAKKVARRRLLLSPPPRDARRRAQVKPRKLSSETDDEYNARVAAMDS